MNKSKLTIYISIISFIATIIAFFYLPDSIPLHWSLDGSVDKVGPKWNVFITGSLPIMIYILLKALPKIDPKRENYKKHASAYSITVSVIIVFLILIHWLTIAVSLGVDLNVGLIVSLLVGVLFIILGNYMPQFRHNYFCGIKTPWTLANEDVWKRTHHFGGYVFIIIGFILIITSFFNNPIFGMISMGSVIISIILLFLYSYIEYKRRINK